MDSNEYIERAAVRHADGEVFSLPRPARHCNVIVFMRDSGKPYNVPGLEERHEQGFVTNTGRFVDRIEARAIAEAAGQLLERESGLEELYSEDVW